MATSSRRWKSWRESARAATSDVDTGGAADPRLRDVGGPSPTGVGARDVDERLVLQAKVIAPTTCAASQATELVGEHVDTLAGARRRTGLKRLRAVDEDALSDLHALAADAGPLSRLRLSAVGDARTRCATWAGLRKSGGRWVANVTSDVHAAPAQRQDETLRSCRSGVKNGAASILPASRRRRGRLIKQREAVFDTILRDGSRVIVER